MEVGRVLSPFRGLNLWEIFWGIFYEISGGLQGLRWLGVVWEAVYKPTFSG
jgi:hypothetical protein